MMKELAANTTAAINHLKDLQRRPLSPEYANYLRQNSETSKQLSDLISSVVQYDQTRAKLEKLEYQALNDQISSLEKQVKGNADLTVAFSRLKDKLSAFLKRQSEQKRAS